MRLHVPQPNRRVTTRRGKNAAVRAERKARDVPPDVRAWTAVTDQGRAELLVPANAPETDSRPESVCCRDRACVGAEENSAGGVHHASGRATYQRARAQVPNPKFDVSIRARGSEEVPVSTERHGAEVAQRSARDWSADLLAAPYIPASDDPPRIRGQGVSIRSKQKPDGVEVGNERRTSLRVSRDIPEANRLVKTRRRQCASVGTERQKFRAAAVTGESTADLLVTR